MARVLFFAGFGAGALMGLATAAHGQPAMAPQAASDSSRPAAQSDAPSEIGVICLTNACMKGTSSAPRRDPAAVARAIDAGDNTALGAEVSQVLAEANGANMTPGSRVNFSDQPPRVIGEMAGLARKSCERAGGDFKTGGVGAFTCE